MIPNILHITSGEDTFSELPPVLLKNVKNHLAANPGMVAKYWSDKRCREFLVAYFRGDLVEAFDDAGRGMYAGAYRGDICRAAVLYTEGGYYMDIDTQLVVPLTELVDPFTTFMAVHRSNQLMAAVPGSEIMEEVIHQILPWYHQFDSGQPVGVLGPRTLDRALQKVCGDCGFDCHKDVLQFRCGEKNIVRLYEERPVDCTRVSDECPPARLQVFLTILGSRHNPLHLLAGLAAPMHGRFIGWSRHEECIGFGCGGSGYSSKDFVAMSNGSTPQVPRSEGLDVETPPLGGPTEPEVLQLGREPAEPARTLVSAPPSPQGVPQPLAPSEYMPLQQAVPMPAATPSSPLASAQQYVPLQQAVPMPLASTQQYIPLQQTVPMPVPTPSSRLASAQQYVPLRLSVPVPLASSPFVSAQQYAPLQQTVPVPLTSAPGVAPQPLVPIQQTMALPLASPLLVSAQSSVPLQQRMPMPVSASPLMSAQSPVPFQQSMPMPMSASPLVPAQPLLPLAPQQPAAVPQVVALR